MNDYDVYDDWLRSCLWWLIMKLFMIRCYVIYGMMLCDLWYDATCLLMMICDDVCDIIDNIRWSIWLI